MSRTWSTKSDAERFVDEFKQWQDSTGGVCVAVNIVLSPAEMADAGYEAIIAEKVTLATAALQRSAKTLADEKEGRNPPVPPPILIGR